MRVMVTRPASEAQGLVEALVRAGVDAVALPLIDISGPVDTQAVRAVWRRLDQFDAVMFVSSNAAHFFYASKPAEAHAFIAQAAIKTRAFVTGPGSRAALLSAGADPAYIDGPPMDGAQFDSEALWAVVQQQVGPGFRLLIVRGSHQGADKRNDEGNGRDWLAQQVRCRGGSVEFVVAYQRSIPVWGAAQRAMAEQATGDHSVWLFSSSEAIANLQLLCPQLVRSNAKALATHSRIAQAAQLAGFGTVRLSSPALKDLVASIESLQ